MHPPIASQTAPEPQGLNCRAFPHDIFTCWTSTYYMLQFAIKYHHAIDGMTADKSLKFELDDEEWGIAEDLVAILQVKISYVITIESQLHTNTRS
jgi:hypothetical protein